MRLHTSRVLACALLATPALATNDDGAQAWLGLDQEITKLSTSLTTQGSGVNIGGLIRSSWQSVEEDLLVDGDSEGFVLLDADLWVEGSEGDYEWRISADLDGAQLDFDTSVDPDDVDIEALQELARFAYVTGGPGGSATLEDAYASWSASDEINILWGSFKAPTSLSNQVDPEDLVMIQRTIAGRAFEEWQLGAMLEGDFEQFAGSLAIQNGFDGLADEYNITARGEFRHNGGAGAGSGRLGAHGSETDDLAATVGLTYQDDEGLGSDTTIFVIDGAATVNQFGVHGEFINLDDGIGNGEIFALTGSMAISDSLEAAIRFQQVDLRDSTSIANVELDRITAGIAYIQEGARWAINISDVDVDASFDGTSAGTDGLIIEVGLTVGMSRG